MTLPARLAAASRPALRENARAGSPFPVAGISSRWQREAARRWRVVSQASTRGIVANDALALREAQSVAPPGPPPEGSTDEVKTAFFLAWLAAALNVGVLGLPAESGPNVFPVGGGWQAAFVRSAYSKSVAAARTLAARAGGAIDGTLAEALNRASHLAAVQRLSLKSFHGLRGITAEVAPAIADRLAAGLRSGLGPEDLAASLAGRYRAIGEVRSRVLARTAVTEAWAEGSLNVYEQAGIRRVVALVEFTLNVHGNAEPCPVCVSLAGRLFSVSEARGIIPVHANCQCGWVPAAG